MTILVTGGAGYIGSHTVVELQNAGYDVVVLDNLSNASEKSLERVSRITGKPVKFYKADILDRDALNEIFDKEEIDSCIHFAGLKAVGESVAKPWEYYENNIAGTLTLVDVMRKHNVKNIIFSSSATVYGDPAIIPITEECPKGQCTNPYGWTKSMLEQILTGNILSLLKGLGIFINFRLQVVITDYTIGRPVEYKHLNMVSIDLDFSVNLSLPDYIGIGKHSSLGAGLLTRKKSNNNL